MDQRLRVHDQSQRSDRKAGHETQHYGDESGNRPVVGLAGNSHIPREFEQDLTDDFDEELEKQNQDFFHGMNEVLRQPRRETTDANPNRIPIRREISLHAWQTGASSKPVAMNPLIILRRTADWVAVDKPVGIAAIPEKAGDTECLQARLERELGARIWVVHRLDKEVSGVILYALNAVAHRSLNMAFEQRRVSKIYLAVAHGIVAEDSGEIDLPLREFGSGRIGVDKEKGKPCLTRWRVRERRADSTLLEMEPHTGRRHQLRAHAYAMGHPLIGDSRYGDKAAQAKFSRLLLHAWRIDFPDMNGERVVIECAPSEDFVSGWESA
jgi:tRNA pseudouridine32 synthase/23S rRNA pseudouridine746 synthase